ncbi:MAG: BlaI/MecI/CopY family transcriptional regulator [Hyphomicrobiales bacterium]
MRTLTKAEEQIMKVLWQIKEGFVNDILDQLPDPKPAYNTVSTIVRILEKKEFVSHVSYGKSHQYYPVVSEKEYTRSYFKSFLNNYFSSSFKSLASFFTKEERLSINELEEIKEMIEKQIDQERLKRKDNEK